MSVLIYRLHCSTGGGGGLSGGSIFGLGVPRSRVYIVEIYEGMGYKTSRGNGVHVTPNLTGQTTQLPHNFLMHKKENSK